MIRIPISHIGSVISTKNWMGTRGKDQNAQEFASYSMGVIWEVILQGRE